MTAYKVTHDLTKSCLINFSSKIYAKKKLTIFGSKNIHGICRENETPAHSSDWYKLLPKKAILWVLGILAGCL